MKKNYLLIVCMVILSTVSLKLNAQKADSIVNAKFPLGLAFNGNDLYVSEFTDKNIFKIDITAQYGFLTSFS